MGKNTTKGYFIIPHSLMHNKKLSKNDIWLYVVMCDSAAYINDVIDGISINRGNLLTTRKLLSDATGLTEREVRTGLDHLLDAGYVKSIESVNVGAGVKNRRTLIKLLYDEVSDQKECSIETGLTGVSDQKAPLNDQKGDQKGDRLLNNHNNNNDLIDLIDTENHFKIFDNSQICSKLTPQEKETLLKEIGSHDLPLVIAYIDNIKNKSKTNCSPFETIRNYWRYGYVPDTTYYQRQKKQETPVEDKTSNYAATMPETPKAPSFDLEVLFEHAKNNTPKINSNKP